MSNLTKLLPILTTLSLILMATPAYAEDAAQAPTAITVNSVSVETNAFGYLLLVQIALLASLSLALWHTQRKRQRSKVPVRIKDEIPVQDDFDTPTL